MSIDWVSDIEEFEREIMKKEHVKVPTIQPQNVKELRKNLIKEEIDETLNALEYDDMIELADGISDAIVVLLGTAITYGIDIRPVWDEVHRSNMSKKGGSFREDGKLLKPKTWTPPNIKDILIEQGMKGE
jgi:predicted HAD superfamily Cof-like phosphohydrolase